MRINSLKICFQSELNSWSIFQFLKRERDRISKRYGGQRFPRPFVSTVKICSTVFYRSRIKIERATERIVEKELEEL